MSKMIRVNTEIYEKIEHLQDVLGSTKQDVVKKAIENLNKDVLLMKADAAFKALKKDKTAWEQELQEREEWSFLNEELNNE